MPFLNGLDLSSEEEWLLKELVNSWRKSPDLVIYDFRITKRLAELICEEVRAQEHKMPEHLEEALERVNEELYGKLEIEDRTISIQEIRYLVKSKNQFTEAVREKQNSGFSRV